MDAIPGLCVRKKGRGELGVSTNATPFRNTNRPHAVGASGGLQNRGFDVPDDSRSGDWIFPFPSSDTRDSGLAARPTGEGPGACDAPTDGVALPHTILDRTDSAAWISSVTDEALCSKRVA